MRDASHNGESFRLKAKPLVETPGGQVQTLTAYVVETHGEKLNITLGPEKHVEHNRPIDQRPRSLLKRCDQPHCSVVNTGKAKLTSCLLWVIAQKIFP